MNVGVKVRSKDRKIKASSAPLQEVPIDSNIQFKNEKKKNAKRMKEYRERIKANPELYETTKMYHAAHMKLKRSQWTEEQKQLNRDQSRERMKRCRERKKSKQTTENKEPRTRQEMEKQKQQREKWKLAKQKQRVNMSSQKKRRVREKDRDRKRKQKGESMSKVLPQQSKSSPVDVSSPPVTDFKAFNTQSALQKAVGRAKSKLPKNPVKYAEVVSTLIDKASPDEQNALKRRGIDSSKHKWTDELTDTMKEAYMSMQGRKKSQINVRREFVRQLAIKVKQRNKSIKICQTMGINRKFFVRSLQNIQPKKRKDAISIDTQNSIEEFYRQEDISINVPNKKIVNKDNESKFVLQGSYFDCYEKFKKNQPNSKVSFSQFVKLKPKNVLAQKKRHLLHCLCEYCEGVRLKIETINKLSTQLKNPDLKPGGKLACVDMILCPKDGQEYKLECIDRLCRNCSTQNLEQKLQPILNLAQVTWQSWDLVKYHNPKTGKESSKRELVERNGTPNRFIELFLAELTFLVRHLFEARWQQVQFGILSKSLKAKQIMVTADFAENFTCFNQNEIQGAHWMRNSVTIHPTIVNYVCPDCPDNQIIEECVDIISDDLVHDAHAFQYFFKVIHQHLTTTQKLDVEEYVIVSDGCAGQYKCKTAFMDASNSLEDFGVVIERAYYGSRHGKNRCDGEGGILKSKVTRAIKNGEAVINNAKKFADYCKETLSKDNNINGKCNHKRRIIIYIRKEDINHGRPVEGIKTLKGTRKLHSVRTVRSGVVMTRRLSCFCPSCQHLDYNHCKNSAYVDKWMETNLRHVPRQNRLQQNTRQDPQPVVADPQPVVADPQPVVADAQPMVADPQPVVDQQLLVLDMDDAFNDVTAVDISFDDTSFNRSLDMAAIDAILDHNTSTHQEEAQQKLLGLRIPYIGSSSTRKQIGINGGRTLMLTLLLTVTFLENYNHLI